MAYTIQNITEISKIIGCPYDFYKEQSNKTDPYYESTLYLVNNGITVNQEDSTPEEQAYTDMYYGARKLTDTLIVKDSPEHPDYPNDKMYVQPHEDAEGKVIGYRIYFKHDDFVIPIATTDQLILVDEVEDNPSMLKMTLTINGETVKANVLCVNEDGSLPTDIYNNLYSSLKSDISSELNVVWRHIGQ